MIFRDLGRGPDLTGWPAAEVTCFFIHHAGGSSASFAGFPRFFPTRWRLRAVELPGRGMAAGAPPWRSTVEAVERLAPAFAEEVRGPYAVFGHSMGALVGYELIREMERRGLPPVWLGVSAMPAPRLVSDFFRDRRDLWPQERLVGFMRSMGGTPEEMLQEPKMVNYLVRVLRDDLAVVDTYEYADGPALGVPLSIFSGDQDPTTTPERVEGWRSCCAAPIVFHSLPGGHFYLFDQVEHVTRCMTQDIQKVLAEMGLS